MLRSALAGSLATTVLRPSQAAAATWQSKVLRADALRVGDVVGTIDGRILRVHAVRRRGRRVHATYTSTSPAGQASVSFDSQGFARATPLLVLARGVPAHALLVDAGPADEVVDGGRP
jgi:hypothetical protein